MAERQLPEGWQDAAAKMMEAHMIEQGEAKSKVVSHASRMIDAMQGKAPDAHSLPSNPGREFASAPDELPAMGWTSVMPTAPSEDGEDIVWKMQLEGNIGEYHSHVFSNERPAAVFNTGFYAGVLAVKLGLVDPELFHADSERKQLPDQVPTPPTV